MARSDEIQPLPTPDFPPAAHQAESAGDEVVPIVLISELPRKQDPSYSRRVQDLDGPLEASGGAMGRMGAILILLISIFALFLASFPARNSDIWMHLAAGRRLTQGERVFDPAPG